MRFSDSGFELPGLVLVTLVLLEVPDEDPVPPLRACASAADSNATNANEARIAAIVVLTVLIIVQFLKINIDDILAIMSGKPLRPSANNPLYQ